jgi:hypothetical protein
MFLLCLGFSYASPFLNPPFPYSRKEKNSTEFPKNRGPWGERTAGRIEGSSVRQTSLFNSGERGYAESNVPTWTFRGEGEGVIFLVMEVEFRRESGERIATGQEAESRR